MHILIASGPRREISLYGILNFGQYLPIKLSTYFTASRTVTESAFTAVIIENEAHKVTLSFGQCLMKFSTHLMVSRFLYFVTENAYAAVTITSQVHEVRFCFGQYLQMKLFTHLIMPLVSCMVPWKMHLQQQLLTTRSFKYPFSIGSSTCSEVENKLCLKS